MGFKIYSEKDVPWEKWSVLTDDFFYVSSDFMSLWKCKGGQPILFVDEEQGAFRAGIGGIMFGNFTLRRYGSMPDGFYGGPFFPEEYETQQQRNFMSAFETFLKSKNVIRATVNKPKTEFDSSVFEVQSTVTHILELNGEDYIPPRREVKKHIRGSRERGGEVRIFDDEADLDRFYELAVLTKKRHRQKPAYPIDFFRQLLKISINNPKILWLKAMLEDKMIASQISFFDKESAFNWQFYYDKKYSFFKPGYLLLDYAINQTINNNIKRFSMGSTPEDLTSLVDYKERWGGIGIEQTNYSYYNWLGRMLYGWRNR